MTPYRKTAIYGQTLIKKRFSRWRRNHRTQSFLSFNRLPKAPFGYVEYKENRIVCQEEWTLQPRGHTTVFESRPVQAAALAPWISIKGKCFFVEGEGAFVKFA